MIQKFVDNYMARKSELESIFSEKHPDDYVDILRAVVSVIGSEEEWANPDPERIHIIDDGDYQGTLVFVIGATGYQPDQYWYVKVSYGSCSGCDTLQGIQDFTDDNPSKEQVRDYMTLALHIVQGLKSMNYERSVEW